MVDLIFGRNFWSMILRFAALPMLATLVAVLFLLIFKPEGGKMAVEFSPLQYAATVPWSIAGSTWFGWGLAFWRFDRSEIPVQSFALYPMLTGLTVVPVLWVLVSTSTDPAVSDYVAATIFGIIAGPLQALLAATLSRYLPHATALRKLRN